MTDFRSLGNYDGQGKSKEEDEYSGMVAVAIMVLAILAAAFIAAGILVWIFA